MFHSLTYRQRYAAFLKIDFPRLPLTKNDKLFTTLAKPGETLVNLHLMKSEQLNNLITKYQGYEEKVTLKNSFVRWAKFVLLIDNPNKTLIYPPYCL